MMMRESVLLLAKDAIARLVSLAYLVRDAIILIEEVDRLLDIVHIEHNRSNNRKTLTDPRQGRQGSAQIMNRKITDSLNRL